MENVSETKIERERGRGGASEIEMRNTLRLTLNAYQTDNCRDTLFLSHCAPTTTATPPLSSSPTIIARTTKCLYNMIHCAHNKIAVHA